MLSRYVHIHETTLIIIKRLHSEFMSAVYVRVIYALSALLGRFSLRLKKHN